MVETKNNYKKRYNNKGQQGRRRYPARTGNGGKRYGLLNFLFSFEGRISKNLFIGFTFFFTILSFLLDVISVSVPVENHQYFNVVFGIINLFILWIVIALGYKRAHSLGISGFYSIVGTVLFKPFFCFLRTERDFPNDSSYKNHFDRFKKIGFFFDKNLFTRILFILIIGALAVIPYALMSKNNFMPQDIKNVLWFVLGVVVFNILQIFFLNAKWFRRYYTNALKVLSFVGYNLFIITVYSAYLLTMLQIAINTAK